MPLDATAPTAATLTTTVAATLAAPLPAAGLTAGRRSGGPPMAVRVWLFALCAMLLVMVGLGGATRLTGSGLSIMEWDPLAGALPPVSQAEWQRLFALYRQIPQYALLHDGFSLSEFQGIFWLEWVHRLWGRLLGLAAILPLAVFAWRGWVSRGLALRLGGIVALGGLQGAVGWFMVASGFEDGRTAVSPYRLVAHLSLALCLYAALFWLALCTRSPRPRRADPAGAWLLRGVLAMTALTIVAGGFVAGNHAGLAYNSFPLMDGRLIPDGYAALTPFWRNLTESIPAVQFDHRLLATLTACAALWVGVRGMRRGAAARQAHAWVALAVILQYGLGVATLLYVVPVSLGTAHQVSAVLLLSAVLAALHATRRGGAPRRSAHP